jgi:predicted transcriptional regulator
VTRAGRAGRVVVRVTPRLRRAVESAAAAGRVCPSVWASRAVLAYACARDYRALESNAEAPWSLYLSAEARAAIDRVADATGAPPSAVLRAALAWAR